MASKYGSPKEILREEWIPPVPGISAPGNYWKDYASDPGAWLGLAAPVKFKRGIRCNDKKMEEYPFPKEVRYCRVEARYLEVSWKIKSEPPAFGAA